MSDAIQLFIELKLVPGHEADFASATAEVLAIAHANGVDLTYDFYRDPATPAMVYAIERHGSADSLSRHFQLAFPALQRVWQAAEPVRTLVLGDLPAELREAMERNGCVVVPTWRYD